MSITATVLSAGAHTEEENKDAPAFLKRRHVWLLSFGTGGMVANIYYIQPLLSTIAADFRISVAMVGVVAMLSQLGTALGMLLFVPLGDTKQRRSLMVRLAIAASLFLAFMATAHGFWWLALASFGVGLTGSTVHVIIPYAAHLASRSHAHHCDIVSVWSAKQPPRCEDVMARADPFHGRSGAAPANVA
jgi:predicted MFS family arabinose efflux permease